MSWSWPSITWIITVQIYRDRWILQSITIVGLRSNGGSNDASFQIKTKGMISALHQRSNAPNTIATIRPMDASSEASIVRSIFIQPLRSSLTFLNAVLRDGRTCPWIFRKFDLFTLSLHVPFVSWCSWCISASIECLKSKFDRERRKNSHLELQTTSSETRNEKPSIRRLIGSFRRLIWVKLRVFILIFHHLV